MTATNKRQTPKALKEYLRTRMLRSRTGLLLVPPNQLGDVLEIAARLGIDLVDYAQVILASLPPEAKRAGISIHAEQARLDEIANASTGTDAVLVAQFDLALARLPREDRGPLWRMLREGFAHRRRALILLMPEGATRLLPEGSEWDAWQDGKRIAAWGDDTLPRVEDFADGQASDAGVLEDIPGVETPGS
jgi:hypothetical protein